MKQTTVHLTARRPIIIHDDEWLEACERQEGDRWHLSVRRYKDKVFLVHGRKARESDSDTRYGPHGWRGGRLIPYDWTALYDAIHKVCTDGDLPPYVAGDTIHALTPEPAGDAVRKIGSEQQ